MPMPRWEDEDEYLTYWAKVLERIHRDDPPPSAEERLERYTHDNWIDILVESISESEGSFFENCRIAYEYGDHAILGELIHRRIREYSISCAETWNVIEEGELDNE